MATHSSILARKVSWTEEPGRRQFIRSQRVGYDQCTKYTYRGLKEEQIWGGKIESFALDMLSLRCLFLLITHQLEMVIKYLNT